MKVKNEPAPSARRGEEDGFLGLFLQARIKESHYAETVWHN